MKRQFVNALRQHYVFDPDNCVLIFEDGSRYTTDEAIIIAKGKPTNDDLRAIHKIKQVLDGEVVGLGDDSPFGGWIVPKTDAPVHRAATSAVVPVLAGKLSSRSKHKGKDHPGGTKGQDWNERSGTLQMRLDL